MAVSLKTDLRFPESGQHGHGSRIIHTVLKIYKLIPLSNTYEEKEKQLFAFVPVYIISILLFGLTIYTKFF